MAQSLLVLIHVLSKLRLFCVIGGKTIVIGLLRFYTPQQLIILNHPSFVLPPIHRGEG